MLFSGGNQILRAGLGRVLSGQNAAEHAQCRRQAGRRR
jgi:hypothetical protein